MGGCASKAVSSKDVVLVEVDKKLKRAESFCAATPMNNFVGGFRFQDEASIETMKQARHRDSVMSEPFGFSQSTECTEPGMEGGRQGPGKTFRIVDNNCGMDPFIAVDDFTVHYPAVFIDHPHRGFESATYILPEQPDCVNENPILLYYDSTCGDQEFPLGKGGLVRMITGSGISHCEVVKSKNDRMRAINIWFNYPREHRLCAPYSRVCNMDTTEMPLLWAADGTRTIVLQGEWGGSRGRCFEGCPSPIEWIHHTIPAGCSVRQPFPEGWTALVYVLNGAGSVEFDGETCELSTAYDDTTPACVRAPAATSAASGGAFDVKATSGELDVIYMASKPAGDRTVVFDLVPDGSGGTFVMSSEAEIKSSLIDWIEHKNGFEYRHEWNSTWFKEVREEMSRGAKPAQVRDDAFSSDLSDHEKSIILLQKRIADGA